MPVEKQRTLRHDEIEKEHRIEIPIPKRGNFFRALKNATVLPDCGNPRVKKRGKAKP
jgi:hypothetical protein